MLHHKTNNFSRLRPIFISPTYVSFPTIQNVAKSLSVILAVPSNCPEMQEIIEREFNAAISSEKAAAGLSTAGTSVVATPGPGSRQSEITHQTDYQRQHAGGIISSAVQSLRARSIKRRNVKGGDWKEPEATAEHGIYEHIYSEPGGVTTFGAVPSIRTTTVTIETDITDDVIEMPKLRRSHSMSTNTPPMICRGPDANGHQPPPTQATGTAAEDKEPPPTTLQPENMQLGKPVKPPRRKTSRSTSPASRTYDATISSPTSTVSATKSFSIS